MVGERVNRCPRRQALVTILDNVRHRIEVATPGAGGSWSIVPLPGVDDGAGFRSIDAHAVDADADDRYFLVTEGLLIPPALALGSVGAGQGAIAKGSRCGHHGYMKEVAAREAKNRFGHLLDAAQSAPVRVTRKGRAVGVMMSVQQYERLRGAAWERLTATMDALGEEASANGLTKARLEALLADES